MSETKVLVFYLMALYGAIMKREEKGERERERERERREGHRSESIRLFRIQPER